MFTGLTIGRVFLDCATLMFIIVYDRVAAVKQSSAHVRDFTTGSPRYEKAFERPVRPPDGSCTRVYFDMQFKRQRIY